MAQRPLLREGGASACSNDLPNDLHHPKSILVGRSCSSFESTRLYDVEMEEPYVIAINAVSGGGKTEIARLVHTSLPSSTLFCFDDFDETNVYPDDFYEWYQRGANLLEFDCPGLSAAIEEEIRAQNSRYLILDYPFGRDHPRLRERIDLSVFIDTPLDVAMARRILRDSLCSTQVTTEKQIADLKKELIHYLSKGRLVYLTTDVHKKDSDLIVDGLASAEAIRDEILAAVRLRR